MASYPPETKAAALAALAAGNTIRWVEKEFGVSRSTLADWKASAGIKTGRVRPDKPDKPDKGSGGSRTRKTGARGVMTAKPDTAEAGGDAGDGVTNGSGEVPAEVLVISPPPAASLPAPREPFDLDGLLLDLLRESLLTLTEQQRYFRNEGFLQKQNAADLAILHGVTADKTVRLLEAYRPDDDDDDDGTGE